ncbi:glutamate mutase L [Phototrophicus methaneseepsis]|uniref:Glutamate mutase L n=1 Tax=Phototrophicus methaneseepsis TaxID=2710758 RepID=A0A7S8EAQ2_9CHLR|nr:glutamate mutase L [Phototrophicus methaneseepsis]QPC83481.1 glutamate mutase L [Phototrophicus methaneseepsis]
MMERAGSILAADFGSVNNRVVLVDVVEGTYRLVSRASGAATVGFPIDDASIGLRRLVDDIGKRTGRTFYDKAGDIISPEGTDRSGVEAFVTTATAGRPMRVALVGLVPEVSLASARRVLSSAFVEIVTVLSLADGRSEEDRLNELILNRPDVILITGGTDAGAERALRTMLSPVKIALQVQEPATRPSILYAGNNKLVATVESIFNDLATVVYSDNVRPSLENENIDAARARFTQVFNTYNMRQRGSFRNVTSDTGIVPTARGYSLVAEYIARTTEQNVLAVDMGSATTIMVASFRGQTDTIVETNYGLGYGAPALVRAAGPDAVRQWLPFESSPEQVLNYAQNKASRPGSIPLDVRDLYFEHGMLRAGVQHMLAKHRGDWPGAGSQGALNDVNLILAAGKGLTGTGHPGWNLLLVADTVQPSGVTVVKADPHGLIPAIGAVATINAEAAAQLLANDDLEHLGTLISLEGKPDPERVAVSMTVITDDGESFKQDLYGGEILLLPVRVGRAITVRLKAGRGLRIGGSRTLRQRIHGGSAGILIDARGRAIDLPADAATRAVQIPKWAAHVAGIDAHTIPDEWLVPVASSGASLDAMFDAALSADAGPSSRDMQRAAAAEDDFFSDVGIDPDLDDFLSDDDPFADLDELRNLS